MCSHSYILEKIGKKVYSQPNIETPQLLRGTLKSGQNSTDSTTDKNKHKKRSQYTRKWRKRKRAREKPKPIKTNHWSAFALSCLLCGLLVLLCFYDPPHAICARWCTPCLRYAASTSKGNRASVLCKCFTLCVLLVSLITSISHHSQHTMCLTIRRKRVLALVNLLAR